MRSGRSIAVLALLLASAFGVAGYAHAQANSQEGDNRSTTTQSGEGSSGDAVAGQIAGVVSAGNASVDATNATDKSDASSGDARGNNFSSHQVGQTAVVPCGGFTADLPCSADLLTTDPIQNVQEGDNKTQTDQSATTLSGDAVAGEVIGVVTSSGGSADLVLANGTTQSDAETGDARFENADNGFTGLANANGGCCPLPTDVLGADATTPIGV